MVRPPAWASPARAHRPAAGARVSLLGTVGALAASHRRSHELRLPILWAAQLLMAGAVLWFFVVHGWAGFFVAQLIVSFAFYAVTPFLTARLSGLDADGSLLSRSIVITFVAAFIGTALAGTMLTQLGGLGCGIALGVCALVAMPFTWKAFGRGECLGTAGGWAAVSTQSGNPTRRTRRRKADLQTSRAAKQRR